MTFIATFAREDTTEFTVEVEGESVETVGEYLDNCGEYDDCTLLSVEAK
jgi:hypothetical protein